MYADLSKAIFEWDELKDAENRFKHGVSFLTAQQVFLDPRRIITKDSQHSRIEQRFFCVARVGNDILTVRFTPRDGAIRIIGAGYWRKGRSAYEKENPIH